MTISIISAIAECFLTMIVMGAAFYVVLRPNNKGE